MRLLSNLVLKRKEMAVALLGAETDCQKIDKPLESLRIETTIDVEIPEIAREETTEEMTGETRGEAKGEETTGANTVTMIETDMTVDALDHLARILAVTNVPDLTMQQLKSIGRHRGTTGMAHLQLVRKNEILERSSSSNWHRG